MKLTKKRRQKTMTEIELSVISWNLCGARWFELPAGDNAHTSKDTREDRKQRLREMIEKITQEHRPAVIALQEVAEYAISGSWEQRCCIVDPPKGYWYAPSLLVDSVDHPHLNEWRNTRIKGHWPSKARLGQGNAFMIRDDMPVFPSVCLARPHIAYKDWIRSRSPHVDAATYQKPCIRNISLNPELYLGDRDTEPRGCSVLHVVFPLGHAGRESPKPLDVFILNTHLTTLLAERRKRNVRERTQLEEAVRIRKEQLDRILKGIICQYEDWMQRGFPERGDPCVPEESETTTRCTPLWLVMGDFNFNRDSEEYRWLSKECSPIVRRGTRWEAAETSVGKEYKPSVDHIFFRPSWQFLVLHYSSIDG